MIIFLKTKIFNDMKKVLIFLAVVLAGCATEPKVDVIQYNEHVTLRLSERPMKKRFRVRGCCEYYNYRLGRYILCTTNDGKCKWCEDLCASSGHL